jgi:hypothetical protein
MIGGRIAMIPMGGDYPLEKNCTQPDNTVIMWLTLKIFKENGYKAVKNK